MDSGEKHGREMEALQKEIDMTEKEVAISNSRYPESR